MIYDRRLRARARACAHLVALQRGAALSSPSPLANECVPHSRQPRRRILEHAEQQQLVVHVEGDLGGASALGAQQASGRLTGVASCEALYQLLDALGRHRDADDPHVAPIRGVPVVPGSHPG